MSIGMSAQAGFAEGDVGQRRSSVVPIDFWTDHIPDGDTLKAVDYVRWAKIGTNGATTEERVDRIKKHNPIVWEAISKAYAHWKEGQEAPVDGTPLDAWSGASKGQIAQLKILNIRTVEDLAFVNDATLERIGSGGRSLRERALKFADAQTSGVATMAAKAAAMEETNRQLTTRLAELEARMAEIDAASAAKRKRKDGDDGG